MDTNIDDVAGPPERSNRLRGPLQRGVEWNKVRYNDEEWVLVIFEHPSCLLYLYLFFRDSPGLRFNFTGTEAEWERRRAQIVPLRWAPPWYDDIGHVSIKIQIPSGMLDHRTRHISVLHVCDKSTMFHSNIGLHRCCIRVSCNEKQPYPAKRWLYGMSLDFIHSPSLEISVQWLAYFHPSRSPSCWLIHWSTFFRWLINLLLLFNHPRVHIFLFSYPWTEGDYCPFASNVETLDHLIFSDTLRWYNLPYNFCFLLWYLKISPPSMCLGDHE